MKEQGKELVDFFRAVAEVMEQHEEIADTFMLIPVDSLRQESRAMGDELAVSAEGGGPERAVQALLSAQSIGRRVCGIDPRTGRLIFC